MRLTMQGVIPVPIREKVISRESGIWNATITFAKGEILFIQAPSGTGKTTLIHCLYGIRKDYEGDIAWDNNSLLTIDEEDMADMRTKKLSIIFQDMRLFPELTAYENIEIKRRLTDTVSEEQVFAWMERLGITEKRNSLGKTLSYGEQQRTAIIRALVQPFDWLLMDEPFSHLDHTNIDKARKLIAEVTSSTNAGILIADLDENKYFDYTKTLML